MQALARTIVDALAALELSRNLTRDQIEEILETLAATLQDTSVPEREALRKIVAADYNELNRDGAPEALLDFYENFAVTFLGDEEPALEAALDDDEDEDEDDEDDEDDDYDEDDEDLDGDDDDVDDEEYDDDDEDLEDDDEDEDEEQMSTRLAA